MNKQEESLSFTEDMAIACCRTCLLSDAMKTCKICQFKAGLIYKQLNKMAELTKDDNVRLNNLKSLILA